MQTTNEYVPTKGDLCYVILETERYGEKAHRSFGAIVRIDKVRINYRRNRKDQISSSSIEISGIEGFAGGVMDSSWDADYSRELLPIHKATAEQVKLFAAARAKRAEVEAKAAKKAQEADEFEAEFKAKHMNEVTARNEYGDVMEFKDGKDCYVFICKRPYKRFTGKGYDVAIEERWDEMSVSVRWEQDRYTFDTSKGKWAASFSGYFNVQPDSLDAHIRCAMAAQAKLAELNQAQLVAA